MKKMLAYSIREHSSEHSDPLVVMSDREFLMLFNSLPERELEFLKKSFSINRSRQDEE